MPKFRVLRTPKVHEYFDGTGVRSEAPPPFKKGEEVELDGASAERWLSRKVVTADLAEPRKKRTKKTAAGG